MLHDEGLAGGQQESWGTEHTYRIRDECPGGKERVLRRNEKAGQLQEEKGGGRIRPTLVPGGAAENSSSGRITWWTRGTLRES